MFIKMQVLKEIQFFHSGGILLLNWPKFFRGELATPGSSRRKQRQLIT
jgi:hypothetical protein